MNIKAGCFQTLRHNQKVKVSTYWQHQAGQRNRESQLQQTLDDMSGTFYRRTVILLCHFLLQTLFKTTIEPHQHQKCTERAYACTHAGTACSERQTVRHEEVGKNEHGNNTRQLLNNLTDCRRRHNLPALQVTAEACQKGYKENSRSQSDNRIIRTAVADNMIINQPIRTKKQ